MNVIESPYLVPFDDTFDLAAAPSSPPKKAPSEAKAKKRLGKHVAAIRDLQRVLYADDRYAVMTVYQAMDAAGKDGTIRAVMSGVNPAGCQVFSFKKPSSEELDHDFLWRTTRRLPQRGRIGVFNRSYYEEALVVRVHPELLKYQRLPNATIDEDFWERRLTAIRAHERHLADSGTLVLKFWLNVSREEQKRRFLARIDHPAKNWKFNAGDVEERHHWDAYMAAYQSALRATSRPWAPWYAIPADDKAFMRMTVAKILRRTLESLDITYPHLDAGAMGELERCRTLLEEE